MEEEGRLVQIARAHSVKFKRNSLAKGDFLIPLEEIRKGPEIGCGAYSKVFLGWYIGEVVAVKVQTRHPDLEKYIVRELALLQSLSHKHVLGYFGASEATSGRVGDWEVPADSPGQVFLVTEFTGFHDLADLLSLDAPLGWKLRIELALGVAEALAYLHSNLVIHRDVKAKNVLVTTDLTVKLSDFGLARQLTSDEPRRMSICGTDSHMAPEVLLGEEYTTQADVFSFGVLLVEIMTRKKLSSQASVLKREPKTNFVMDLNEMRAICEAQGAPSSLITLACQCCDSEPVLRPSVDVVVEWIAELLAQCPEDTEGRPTPPPTPEMPTGLGSPHVLAAEPPANLQIEGEEPVQPKKQGWLYKKKGTNALRLWHKRWFVLDPIEATLSWFSSQEEANACAQDNKKDRLVYLESCLLLPAGPLQIRLMNKADVMEANHDDQDLTSITSNNRVIAAATKREMVEWAQAIQAVIARCEANASNPHMSCEGRVRAPTWRGSTIIPEHMLELMARKRLNTHETNTIQNFLATKRTEQIVQHLQRNPAPIESVQDWLDVVKLKHLWPKFFESGYTSLKQIVALGLEESDLDAIGITDSSERTTLLIGSSLNALSPKLRVCVESNLILGGIVVYKVMSAYQLWRASIVLRFSDFAKLHGALKLAIKRPSNQAAQPLSLPPFPQSQSLTKLLQNQKSEEFRSTRQAELHQYMRALAAAVDDGHHRTELGIVLKNLGLGWVGLDG